jgi:light-independent protochlorophyllide reductase subunit B
MQLTLWTYEGPPHVGAMRIAASMRGVHYVLHAPQGDTYADLLFTMIERQDRRPPVTYTTFQARDLGGDTAELVKTAVSDACARYRPDLLLVGESCTAELIQDQPGTLSQGMNLPVPIVPLELPAYSKKEHWGAAETLYQIVRTLLADRVPPPGQARPVREPLAAPPDGAARRRPRANLIGPTVLGFRCRDDVEEVRRLLDALGIDVNAVVPLGADCDDIRRLPEADFNIDLYPEVSRTTVNWLQRAFGMPFTKITPMGVGATREFVAEVARLAGVDPAPVLSRERPGVATLSASQSRMQWYARSVDATYLTGKRVFIFGDATHAVAAARVAAQEMGFTVVGLGTWCRELAREVRDAARLYGVEPLITDDYLEVESAIAAASPELVLGTQMERHIAKRLGIACAVISVPIHVQDVPARYSPVFGFEGANVLFDTWVHPLVMGLEEHLLQMFRDDFEFHGDAAASHLPVSTPPSAATSSAATSSAASATATAATAVASSAATSTAAAAGHGPAVETGAALHAQGAATVAKGAAAVGVTPPPGATGWTAEGEKELQKIPFFVRGKARRNTERYAQEHGVTRITVETLYEAKAHFGR